MKRLVTNPMILKELQQRLRERRAWLLHTLYLLVLAGTVSFAYYASTDPVMAGGPREVQGADIGMAIFLTVIFTQIVVLLLMAPVFSAGSLTIEKEQRTLAGLLTSLLTPVQIWWGKFIAALLFLVLLLVSALPILSLPFALGGVGPREVVIAAGITLLVLASLSSVGLYCSSFFRRSVHATAVSYAIVIALTVLTAVAFLILESRWQTSHAASQAIVEPPGYIRATLYLKPFFPLLAIFAEAEQRHFRDWATSLIFFAALGCLATILAARNLKHAG